VAVGGLRDRAEALLSLGETIPDISSCDDAFADIAAVIEEDEQSGEDLDKPGAEMVARLLDCYERALALIRQEDVARGEEEDDLTFYIRLRLILHFRLAARLFDTSIRLQDVDCEGLGFCVVAYKLRHQSDPHALSALENYYNRFPRSGHLFWLQYLRARAADDWSKARGFLLNARVSRGFDGRADRTAWAAFGMPDRLAPDREPGLRRMAAPYGGIGEGAGVAPADDARLPARLRDELSAVRRGEARRHELNANIAALHRGVLYRNYEQTRVADVGEDLFRVFYFVFPRKDVNIPALYVSKNFGARVVSTPMIDLVARSVGKIDSRWDTDHDLLIARENMTFLRRIWRNYETGALNLPNLIPRLYLSPSVEHIPLVRTLWPNSKIRILVPSGEHCEALRTAFPGLDGYAVIYRRLDLGRDIVAMRRELGLSRDIFKPLPQLRARLAEFLYPSVPFTGEAVLKHDSLNDGNLKMVR
jgi:hypothetical protein